MLQKNEFICRKLLQFDNFLLQFDNFFNFKFGNITGCTVLWKEIFLDEMGGKLKIGALNVTFGAMYVLTHLYYFGFLQV